jgi:hypothetical protein
MPKSPAQISRQISDNSKMVHEYELQLAHYGGRTCVNPKKTTDALIRLKNENKDLRRELEAAKERERKFMKTR